MKKALDFIATISRLGLVILAFYLAIKQNYLASIIIWLQLIYFKLLDFK